METAKLKKFARLARRSLLEQVSAKLKLVLAENSAARRERAEAVKKLEESIKGHGKEQVIERVAYIWFNRFCALRFTDVNRYTRIGVVSPAEGQFQPEILAEAKMGHIDEQMVPETSRKQIFALLDGKAPSRDPQGEAYRLLVVAACNFFHRAMPFLFQRIDDYTELLMPDDLLSGNSILAYTREAMTPDACEDVEVIGWLYQFYISEKKDEVFDGLKKNKKITPENIPAATQLFTPHWIVRYLVENSLGRLWMLNRPNSSLKERMEYYIEPQIDTDGHRLKGNKKNICVNLCESVVPISSPEEINICDPACGSGHMLTYAFDLLYAIYEEEGYEPAEIPEKILTHNLYGIEIDERAGELAAFALTMKARSRSRRFFRKSVKPNICVLRNVKFEDGELVAVVSNQLSAAGKETKSAFLHDMRAFEEADNFGSLIRPTMTTEQIAEVEKVVTDYYKLTTDIFEGEVLSKVLQALRQADYLSPKYHVVIANPPYMGGKGMNGRLGTWAKDNYPNSKSDLFAMFIQRNLVLAQKHGMVAMITMQSWMFLSSFGALRARLLGQCTLLSMAHLGARAFDSIGGEVVSTTAFVLENANRLNYRGSYLRLGDGNSEAEKNDAIRKAVKKPDCGWFYRAAASDFKKIPGSPIVYWACKRVYEIFETCPTVEKIAIPKQGSTIGDNERFLRMWFELDIPLSINWRKTVKGGVYRRWYGNNLYVTNWGESGELIKSTGRATIRNANYLFSRGIEWSRISSSVPSFRILQEGFFHESASGVAFPIQHDLHPVLGLFNAQLTRYFLSLLNPTLTFQSGDVARIPFIKVGCDSQIRKLVRLAQSDWDAYETSWDFTSLPLLNPDYRQPTLKATYQKLRAHWWEMTLEMQRLEEENNRIFIEAYGLQDELTPEVPLNEITLTCNPHYRYGVEECEVGSEKWEEMEARLLQDTIKELVSYAVGCMFGRYALEKPGLVLANQGETIEDYYKKLSEPQMDTDGHRLTTKEEDICVNPCESVVQNSLPADEDNVIPMLDGDWFTDDITERFKQFLKVAFGPEQYEENPRFIEQALNIKGRRNYGIRDYFLKEFYTDHVKRYKKRPIYWMFSSPKGSFNALIYMHRYRPDTVSVVLNDYLREFRTKLTAHKDHLEAVSISASSSQGEKTRALKEIEKITKMIAELEEYEREVLYPLATEQVEIDLDDGVKVNYPKFGKALKKIPGL